MRCRAWRPPKLFIALMYDEFKLSRNLFIARGDFLANNNVAHFSHSVFPSIHDKGWRVRGKYDLSIRVKFANQRNQIFLPLKV